MKLLALIVVALMQSVSILVIMEQQGKLALGISLCLGCNVFLVLFPLMLAVAEPTEKEEPTIDWERDGF